MMMGMDHEDHEVVNRDALQVQYWESASSNGYSPLTSYHMSVAPVRGFANRFMSIHRPHVAKQIVWTSEVQPGAASTIRQLQEADPNVHVLFFFSDR